MRPRPNYYDSESGNRWMLSYLDVLTILLILFVAVSAQGLRSQTSCMLDYLRGDWGKPAVATGWKGRVLIIESSEESGFTLKERQILRALYPGSTVHIIQGAGHGSFMTHPQEFNDTVAGFLAERKS